MDAFTAMFTPFVAAAAEQTSAPVEEARKSVGMNALFCVIA